jgi:hypothetical protein
MSKTEFTYGVNCDLTLCCQQFIFHVHRDIISQASPVFMSRLNCPFIKFSNEMIHLGKDDPTSLKLVFGIIYSSILGDIMVKIPYEDVNLDAVVSKYDLGGVRNIINYSRRMESMERANSFEKAYLIADSENRIKNLEIELQKEKTKAGSLVDYRHRSLNGTRVIEIEFTLKDCLTKRRTGTIIANDEDGGSEIGIRWDDGNESHNLCCNKHGINKLRYL